MSGITGIYAFNQVGGFYMINLAKAIDRLSSRGQESRGSFLGRDLTALGHRGTNDAYQHKQPFTEEAERYTIVMDGMISNGGVLRDSLAAEGIQFISDSEVEVVLRLYMQRGPQFLQELAGSFALAIYDKEENSLLLARDRMGEKPLLYFLDEDKFIFSSEMKSLLSYNIPKTIDPVSLSQYFQMHYVAGPETIIENVRKLEPGHFITVKDKAVEIKRYFSRKDHNHYDLDYGQAKEQMKVLLEASVHQIIDRNPGVGVLMDGGVGSTAIAAIASVSIPGLPTYSLSLKSPTSGKKNVPAWQAAKLKTYHTVFSFSEDDISEEVLAMLDYMDEPFADTSSIPLFLIYKKIRSRTQAVLSSAGAEVLCGAGSKYYTDYLLQHRSIKMDFIKNFGYLTQAFSKGKGGSEASWYYLYLQSRQSVSERYWERNTSSEPSDVFTLLLDAPSEEVHQGLKDRKNAFLNILKGKAPLEEMVKAEMEFVLPYNTLFKTDMMSMAQGLQVCLPFMDGAVVDFLTSLPMRFKTDSLGNNRIVKAVLDGILPDVFPYNSGENLEISPARLLKNELKFLADELFGKDFVTQQRIFKYEAIQALRNKASIPGHRDSEAMLWSLFAFQYWWKRYAREG